jgi:hypothetical protein
LFKQQRIGYTKTIKFTIAEKVLKIKQSLKSFVFLVMNHNTTKRSAVVVMVMRYGNILKQIKVNGKTRYVLAVGKKLSIYEYKDGKLYVSEEHIFDDYETAQEIAFGKKTNIKGILYNT